MRVSAAKTAPRVEQNIYLTSKHIKAYGKNNDYPQKVLEIIGSSGTGVTCMDIYVKFVAGAGFNDQAFSQQVLNANNERADSLLRKAAKDLKNFNGFAILVKFDGMVRPVEYYNVPFEQCRIEISSAKEYTGRLAVYDDWTGISGLPYKQEDVVYIDQFDLTVVQAQMQAAGGPEDFIGQLYYFTADGDFEYPLSPFDPIVTDMLTEDSVSTVKHRNAKHNFLPSGILVRKGKKPHLKPNGTVDEADPYNRAIAESADAFRRAQGDENTSKIWVVDIDADEEMPEFINFLANNYDKAYELTEKTVQENIGRMFKIPPILRGVDIGAGFGADLMNNAYAFMNSVTVDERRMLEFAFRDLLQGYAIAYNDFTIKPLSYIQAGT